MQSKLIWVKAKFNYKNGLSINRKKFSTNDDEIILNCNRSIILNGNNENELFEQLVAVSSRYGKTHFGVANLTFGDSRSLKLFNLDLDLISKELLDPQQKVQKSMYLEFKKNSSLRKNFFIYNLLLEIQCKINKDLTHFTRETLSSLSELKLKLLFTKNRSKVFKEKSYLNISIKELLVGPEEFKRNSESIFVVDDNDSEYLVYLYGMPYQLLLFSKNSEEFKNYLLNLSISKEDFYYFISQATLLLLNKHIKTNRKIIFNFLTDLISAFKDPRFNTIRKQFALYYILWHRIRLYENALTISEVSMALKDYIDLLTDCENSFVYEFCDPEKEILGIFANKEANSTIKCVLENNYILAKKIAMWFKDRYYLPSIGSLKDLDFLKILKLNLFSLFHPYFLFTIIFSWLAILFSDEHWNISKKLIIRKEIDGNEINQYLGSLINFFSENNQVRLEEILTNITLIKLNLNYILFLSVVSFFIILIMNLYKSKTLKLYVEPKIFLKLKRSACFFLYGYFWSFATGSFFLYGLEVLKDRSANHGVFAFLVVGSLWSLFISLFLNNFKERKE